MKKTLYSSVALVSLVALVGCNDKMNQFRADYFSTNPNPLEVVGQQVPATVTANVPAKFFKKNAVVTVTPTLVYAAGETQSTPVTFQGEKVRANNQVVSYTNGGTYSIPVSYAYNPDMLKSELYLDFNVQQGNKNYVLPRVKVADGVIATAVLADAGTVVPATAADKFQRIINEKYTADIRFLINQANIRQSELAQQGITDLHGQLRQAAESPNREIAEINISSYASPEGAYDFNQRLAENREKATEEYLKEQLRKDKIAEFGELTSQFTAEDWEGFQQLVQASDMQDKDLVISVLSQVSDPELREEEIRNLASVFETLADEILPQLRRSRLTASVNVIGKSDAEITELAQSNPSALSVDELLYAATLTDDNNRKAQIYEQATRIYPNDYRGYNNLAKAQYVNKDYTAAAANLRKAAQLEPRSAEVAMNQGLLSLVNADYNAAKTSLGNASSLDGVGEALGVYYLSTGDNSAAVRAFGNSKSNNAALAQILTKDYNSARNTLAAVANPDATTYYLTAIVGARTNNASVVADNLAKAIRLDDSLAAKAINDLEFANFNLANVIR